MNQNSELNILTNNTKQEPEKSTDEKSPSIQQIVERYLPDVEWMGATQGRATCPGTHRHTSRSHKNDCWVFINGTPTVTCLHDSCQGEVASVNSSIRSAWSLFQPPLDEAAMSAARDKAAKRHDAESRARASLPEILKQYKWDLADIEEDGLPGGYHATMFFLQRMWKPEDTIWIGEPEETGSQSYAGHFKPYEKWNESIRMAVQFYGCFSFRHHYTTASTFKPGTYSRANVNVLTTPYLITEGDNVLGVVPETNEQKLANKNASGAVAKWLREKVGLTLRAVVDSGNKSLHFWWEMPKLEVFEELRIVLPCLGFDRAMFKPSQPARLPGVIRDNGNEQKLLWIA